MLKFRRIRPKDIVMMSVAALLMALAMVYYASIHVMLSVFEIFFVASLLVVFSRRASAVIIATLLGGLLSMIFGSILDMPGGSTLMCVLVLSMMIFEAIAMIGSVISSENEASIIAAAGISGAALPFLIYHLMKISIKDNLALLAADSVDYMVVGICAAAFALAIWHLVRCNKSVLMFVHER